MPIGRISGSRRGVLAIAATAAFAASSGWTAFIASRPDAKVVAIHEAIDKGMTPPPVQLAIDKLILPWEGLVLRAHWDRYAKIYDICHGETRINGKPVTADMVFTPAECKAMLVRRVIHDYYLPLVDKGKGFVDAPDSVQASMISGAYNFGVGSKKPRRGQLGSTAMEFVAAHKYREACAAQTAFNKAGPEHRVVQGLVKRREMGDAQRLGEAELCLSGLPS